MQEIAISMIVPFYKGNRYINELLENAGCAAAQLRQQCGVDMEVVIVNDSPDVPVNITIEPALPVRVIANERNLGIQGSRIHGIQEARGVYIQMLDQDDLLVPENYAQQYLLAKNCDIVVGNARYQFGETFRNLYANAAVMRYYICQARFLYIRNQIASPGQCLIRKSAIPAYWLENPMKINGSDDYYLWVLMFRDGVKTAQNPNPTYIHRNSEEGNLSFDLDKMHRSNLEMCDLLKKNNNYPQKSLEVLRRSIQFKHLYDTHRLKPMDFLRYGDKLLDNGFYKIYTATLKLFYGQ